MPTGELDQHPVAGRLDDATAVLGDGRVDQLAPQDPEGRQRALLVLSDHPRIPGNVGRQDRRESAFDALRRHRRILHAAIITPLFGVMRIVGRTPRLPVRIPALPSCFPARPRQFPCLASITPDKSKTCSLKPRDQGKFPWSREFPLPEFLGWQHGARRPILLCHAVVARHRTPPDGTPPGDIEKPFRLSSEFKPAGDQPRAIDELCAGLGRGEKDQVLLGVTGSGKTFTMAHVIARSGRPAIILAPNKTLAAQLYGEMKSFFPENAVEYFVSYYDYYQPEAYVPRTDTYVEKESSLNEQIDRMRHS